MFELIIHFNPFVGQCMKSAADYIYESCDKLDITDVTVNNTDSDYLTIIIFDHKDDLQLFLKKKQKRVRTIEEYELHEKHLTERREKYAEKKEREKDNDR